MTDAEVQECLARCREGDERAILDLFNYMYPHVAKLVQSNLPAKESAEDLVQQVSIKVMSNLHQFSDKVPFLHWVSRIAVNTCLNRIRHESHTARLLQRAVERQRELDAKKAGAPRSIPAEP